MACLNTDGLSISAHFYKKQPLYYSTTTLSNRFGDAIDKKYYAIKRPETSSASRVS
jgi:hypothetical protein